MKIEEKLEKNEENRLKILKYGVKIEQKSLKIVNDKIDLKCKNWSKMKKKVCKLMEVVLNIEQKSLKNHWKLAKVTKKMLEIVEIELKMNRNTQKSENHETMSKNVWKLAKNRYKSLKIK